jgi:DNA-binding NarL/FixJ family response regulator
MTTLDVRHGGEPSVGTAGGGSGPVHDDHLTTIYRYAARRGGIGTLDEVAADLGLAIHEVAAAIDHLVGSHLLRTEPGSGDRLVAVDPEVAAVLLVSPMEREIYQRRELIAQIRERTELFRQDYARTGRATTELAGGERVTGTMEVRGYLKVAGDSCRQEVMVLQAGQEPDDFDELLKVCQRLLERGVQVRIVCQHRSRADLTTRTKIKSVTDAGALVRTVSHVPRGAVVFDRELAVLLGSDEGETTASRVRNEGVVQFLLDTFDHVWDAATPVGSIESGYAEVADDLQQTIAGLMAKGFTDEVLARKLGMSVRTCRRHIAALMRDLNAVSRFQAGVQSVRRSLVEEN